MHLQLHLHADRRGSSNVGLFDEHGGMLAPLHSATARWLMDGPGHLAKMDAVATWLAEHVGLEASSLGESDQEPKSTEAEAEVESTDVRAPAVQSVSARQLHVVRQFVEAAFREERARWAAAVSELR